MDTGWGWPQSPEHQLLGFHTQTQSDQTWSWVHSDLTGNLGISLICTPHSILFCFMRRGLVAPNTLQDEDSSSVLISMKGRVLWRCQHPKSPLASLTSLVCLFLFPRTSPLWVPKAETILLGAAPKEAGSPSRTPCISAQTGLIAPNPQTHV